jgi:hypothetical protein
MPNENVQIDTTILDQLIDANRQQAVLDEFRRRAEQNKDSVDPAVYQRVLEDYAARMQALDARVTPLRAVAREAFGALRDAYRAVGQEQERARLEKQELEFRHQIGEVDAADLEARIARPVKALDDCQRATERLDQLRARFAEAFGSEEALLGLVTHKLETGQPEPSGAPVARAFLRVEGDGQDAAEYALGVVARIGRAEENDICIQGRGISRQHAVIHAGPGGFVIRDLDSQNGTIVNGERVAERTLGDGDQIGLGDARLRFRFPG